jgi:hypothetical protein
MVCVMRPPVAFHALHTAYMENPTETTEYNANLRRVNDTMAPLLPWI